MRPLLGFAILLLGLSNASPEPEYLSSFSAYLHGTEGAASPPIEIESSTGRADRLSFASLLPHQLSVATLQPPDGNAAAAIDVDAAGTADVDAAVRTEVPRTDRPAGLSLAEVCNALYTSAQNNDLPIPFFANLIWQESRLRDDAVSPKGALGIAQFMPKVAVETGLANPFDPMQAIPASARFLQRLRLQFGNLGFVAAAYNAGARRVIEWLEHRRGLPRETRGYVVQVTGLSAEAWRRIAISDAALTFARPLPCRSLPTFANFEQEQSAQARLEQAKLARAQAALDAAAHQPAARNVVGKEAGRHARREARRAGHDGHAGRREAAHHPRSGREKRRSA